jgi:hypothetical protein
MKERRPSGEPVLADVGPPFMLSLDVAGYRSVVRTLRTAEGQPPLLIWLWWATDFSALAVPALSLREPSL